MGLPRLKSVRRGGSVLATSLLTLGILVLVNFIGTRRFIRQDLTSERRFSLSPQSRQILDSLAADISLLAFFPADDPEQVTVRRLLDVYRSASSRVTVDFIDPDREPTRAMRYGVREPGVFVASSDRTEKAGSVTEEGITNAILRVIRNRKVTVGFLTGHGELEPGGRDRDGIFAATSILSDSNYELSRVGLLARGGFSESLEVLVVLSPRQEPPPEEIEAMDAFLKQGGRLLALLDPAPRAGLREFLDRWGVIVGDDAVIDAGSAGRMVGLDRFAPIVTRYERSPITRGFNFATFFPLARSVGVAETLPRETRGWILFRSGDGSWAETDPLDGREKLDPGRDRLGPIPLAAAVQYPGAGGARLVVFGDSDFASNKHWRIPGAGDLFLNSLAWLAERGDEIAVRSVEPGDRRVDLTARQARVVFTFGVVFLPLFIAGAGLWAAWRRHGR